MKIPEHRLALSLNRSKKGFLSKISLFFHGCCGRKGLGLSGTVRASPSSPSPSLCLCPLCRKENFDSIPDLEFNPIRGKIVHAFFDKR